MSMNVELRLLGAYRPAGPRAAASGSVWGPQRWPRCPAWPTERAGYGETGTERGGTVGRKPAGSAWGCAWLVEAGTWTHTGVPAGVHECAGKVRSWGSGAWRVRDAEERHVRVPCPAEAARGSIATPAMFGAGALDFERAAPEGTRRSWPCGAAPRAHLGAAPPARPEGRVRGVRRAWLCRPGGDPARAGCASFQGFLALPSLRVLENPVERSAFPSSRAPERAPPPYSAPPAGPGQPKAGKR